MDRVAQLKEVQDEARALFQKKNADYGDSFATYGPVGVLVRMGDKISRLNSITQKGVHLINTESLRDTLVDLHNYSAMAVLLLDEGRDITVNTSSNKTTRVEELKNEQNEKQENQIEFMKKIRTLRGFTDIEPY
jgi:hypothetical protein